MPLFVLAWLKSIGSSVLGFLAKLNAWQILCVGLGLFALVQHFSLAGERRHSAKLQKQLTECVSARHADQQSYAEAQREAQVQNKAQVQKIEQQYQRNSDDERQAYLDDLAKLRAMRMRPQIRTTPGPANPANPSPAPAPSGRADADGLRLSPDQYLQAQEVELRLMHLQNWVAQQLSVDPNK